MHILGEIRSMRRRDMDKNERFRLNAEDMREDAEFRKYIIESLAYNVSRILPGGDGVKGDHGPRTHPDAQKAAERREEERARAREARRNQRDQPHDQRQQ